MSGDEAQQVARKRRQYVVGLVLLLIVVFEWTGSNFLTQDLFDDGYDKPFIVTYMNTASFSVYLIPALVKYLSKKRSLGKPWRGEGYQALADPEDEPQLDEENHTSDLPDAENAHPEGDPPLTTRETAKLASLFCFFWFLANWTVNASLGFTSVASTTILASMSGFFTLLIGRAFRVESLSMEKIGAVVVSFVGGILVSLADTPGKSPGQPPTATPTAASTRPHDRALIGDVLALSSALFYALYVVLLKVRIGEESRINMQLFFGFVGVFNVLACWPIGIILHFTGIETFALPGSRKAWYAVLLNMFITLSSDFIYVLAMLKTTPLVVTVGLSLTIPLAVGGDLLLGTSASAQTLIGATFVLLAFIVVGLEDRDEATVPSGGAVSRIEVRGRSIERSNGRQDVPLLNQTEDDENLRKSVEAIFAAKHHARRKGRESRVESFDANGQTRAGHEGSIPLDRGRSRTRSGTFRRERISGSLRRSEERRTRSRAGRKSSSDDASRRDGRGRDWEYGNPLLSDSDGHNEL